MAVPTRIELAIFCVTGRRDNRYTTGPFIWLREMDLNQRPLGYEPNELPSCSIPRYNLQTSYGGERGIRTPAPSPTSRFSRPVPSTRLGYFSKISKMCLTKLIITHYILLVNKFYAKYLKIFKKQTLFVNINYLNTVLKFNPRPWFIKKLLFLNYKLYYIVL